MKYSPAYAVSGMILVAAMALTACSEEKILPSGKVLPPEKTDQIVIEYVYPPIPAHQQIHDLLKERQTLETLKEFLSPFRLRWPLYVSLKECDGEADAWYGDDKITICYEYIEELRQNMPAETTPSGIEPIDTAVGPFFDTVLHEFAHALFDYLDVPVLGREEDAADAVAAIIYLNLGKDEARRLIMGATYAYMLEVVDTDPPTMEEYADEQSTSEQRAFNLLCIAYGADPELFEDVVKAGGLPDFRAELCEEEYELISIAYDKLIGPHIDPDLAEKIFDRAWLPATTSSMLDMNDQN
ncbi:DUF4344 domain-containing metallopeptidase [Pseudomonadota bacterium]